MPRYFTNRLDSWVIGIDGTKVFGQTFEAKDFIKATLGGRWDGDSKTWTVDSARVEAATKSAMGLYDASDAQIAKLTARKIAKVAQANNGWCNKCHSYCYGDCTASNR